MNLANKNKICQCIIYVQCLKQKQNKTKKSVKQKQIYSKLEMSLSWMEINITLKIGTGICLSYFQGFRYEQQN